MNKHAVDPPCDKLSSKSSKIMHKKLTPVELLPTVPIGMLA